MPKPRLVTIGPSHYCEKARWALERAGIEYVEEAHAPILHYAATLVRRGQRTTPILVTPHGTIRDSTDILHHADKFVDASRRLFPEGGTARKDVEELEELFDRKLGPATRRLAYDYVLQDPRLFRRLVEPGIGRVERTMFRIAQPRIASMLKRGLRIDAEGVRKSEARILDVFDEVEARLDRGGRYLVGDAFTAADLTFAALAAPVVLPPEYGWPLPAFDRDPSDRREGLERFRSRRAGSFALRIYRDDRRTRAVA